MKKNYITWRQITIHSLVVHVQIASNNNELSMNKKCKWMHVQQNLQSILIQYTIHTIAKSLIDKNIVMLSDYRNNRIKLTSDLCNVITCLFPDCHTCRMTFVKQNMILHIKLVQRSNRFRLKYSSLLSCLQYTCTIAHVQFELFSLSKE